MTTTEHDPISDEQVTSSRWEEFKRLLIADWRDDDFGRHTIYWCIIILGGFFGYVLVVLSGRALGLVG